ncbi:5-oxoprolinase subunit PxpB [Paraburkholderia sabiae]|uniref:5-oxoprolinase subunit PxpB n=1 Tax=Paraburkholderia sabiae TaxID=273251 RepID=A0ABU9QMJ7_9BURK|nr:5-oxoprolinase subunit PxpB [Paraburkholderia sabiae]WJZ79255.1 5-oxoprolinase subunit PxpB [Paraburkholderia sabiae]CAD6560751.1 hypothetical protein LMG24235_07058 [Paraburkholderia sabiae]
MATVDRLDDSIVDSEQALPLNVPLRISSAGVGGILLDPSKESYDSDVQSRLVWLAERLRGSDMRTRAIRQAILGVNNLLVLFDPLELAPQDARELTLDLWQRAEHSEKTQKTFEFDVDYGGEGGPDLVTTADGLGMTVAELIRSHSEATYTVSCIGSMPGFPYMTGLPNALQTKRRANPRMSLACGSVIIAGAQAAILPMTAPCGWHALGRSERAIFDSHSSQPCLLSAGDLVRFNVRKVLS